MERVLGLDLGSRTLGVAVSDPLGMIARTVETFRFEEDDYDAALKRCGELIKEFSAKPARLEIDPEDPRKVWVEISEGKYHQVKRMCERVGKNVLFLKRIAIGDLKLDETLECGNADLRRTGDLRMVNPVPLHL